MKDFSLDKKFDGFLNKLWIKKSMDYAKESLGKGAKIILDLGCGHAPYRGIFAERNTLYYCGDLRPISGIDLILNLNLDLPFKKNKIDFIILSEVLEHLRNPLLTLSRIREILAPCGKLLITVPSFFRPHEIPHDYYRFTFEGFDLLLEEAGFREIQIWGFGDNFTVLALSFIFAIRNTRLPRKVSLFAVAIINSIFYFRDRAKLLSKNRNRNVIGLFALVAK